MDYLTVGLLVLIAVLVVATLWLGWRLRSRPLLKVEDDRLVAVRRPAPEFVKCNVKHFIFARYDPETATTIQGDVWRHPYCENLSDEQITDEVQAASWMGGHPEPNWRHVETRGEVHLIKL